MEKIPTIQHSLDYLQYSVNYPDGLGEIPRDHTRLRAVLQSAIPYIQGAYNGLDGIAPNMSGLQAYTHGEQFGYADVFCNPDYPAQKIGVRMRGDELNFWRDLGRTDHELIQWVNLAKGKPSRLDIAFDCRDYKIDIERIYKDWKKGSFQTRARSAHLEPYAIIQPDGRVEESFTLYIGSRTSDIMLRIYDKGIESKTGGDWVRFEIELKGDTALQACIDMHAHGIAPIARGILAQFVLKSPYKFYRDLMNEKSVPMTAIGRKLTNRQKWVVDIVLPLLREEIGKEWVSTEHYSYHVGNQCYSLTELVEQIVGQHWRERANVYAEMFNREGKRHE